MYESPVQFTFRQRFQLVVVPFIFSQLLRVIAFTCHTDVIDTEHYGPLTRQNRPFILAFWHEVLALAAWHFRGTGYHTLTSYSFDGEMAARVIRYYGLNAVRGSSSRGGSEALQQMTTALGLGIVIGFTLDGPKGPRREAKPGVAILAARAQVPIVPTVFFVSNAWRLRSWDRFVIPKPFSRIICAFGPAIEPPADESAESVEAKRLEVESALNKLHEELEGQTRS